MTSTKRWFTPETSDDFVINHLQLDKIFEKFVVRSQTFMEL